MKGVTTAEREDTVGMTKEDEADEDFAGETDERVTKDNFYSAKLEESKKEKISIIYRNVGTYRNLKDETDETDGTSTIVDLKITVVNWGKLQNSNGGTYGYPTIFFAKDAIDVYLTNSPNIEWVEYKYEFFKHNTNNLINITGHETFTDIDGYEYFQPLTGSGIDQVYLIKGTELNVDKGKDKIKSVSGENLGADLKTHWAMVLLNGSSFSFRYSLKDYDTGDSVFITPADHRNYYHYATSAKSLAPFEFTKPKKEVDQESVYYKNSFNYTITQFIPGTSDEFYYTKYQIKDTLESCLEVCGDVKVKDDSGDLKKDASGNFVKDEVIFFNYYIDKRN